MIKLQYIRALFWRKYTLQCVVCTHLSSNRQNILYICMTPSEMIHSILYLCCRCTLSTLKNLISFRPSAHVLKPQLACWRHSAWNPGYGNQSIPNLLCSVPRLLSSCSLFFIRTFLTPVHFSLFSVKRCVSETPHPESVMIKRVWHAVIPSSLALFLFSHSSCVFRSGNHLLNSNQPNPSCSSQVV